MRSVRLGGPILTLHRALLLSLSTSSQPEIAPSGAWNSHMSHLQLRAADGHTFSSYLARPADRPRGAVVVVQEIFGVTGHIERVADQYAAEGYLAIAPALFDRLQPGVNLAYDEAGVACGVGFMQQADFGHVMLDLQAAIDAVDHAGAVGMVGYC
jgi:carboxymethylenebutenolidase